MCLIELWIFFTLNSIYLQNNIMYMPYITVSKFPLLHEINLSDDKHDGCYYWNKNYPSFCMVRKGAFSPMARYQYL